ncbi:hypothetical protein [Azospirillum argentinense]|uniref:LamG-like jellyroll fold domain-containing protein n=1 Tax=Azospirillum argentinense TaxID=2970906 RepID=UPI0032DF2BC4
MTTQSDLRAINGDIYNGSTNPGGLDGPGGMEANFPRALGLIAQGLDDMAVYLSQANFVAAQASVATILQLCQALVAQITAGSTSALAFPAVDKLLLSTPNVAQVYVYDTRLDDLTADGRRWNEPGRCAHLSYWHEAAGVYRGVKRDFPAVALIVALREQWWIFDALDLDPLTGMPRLWAGSNPTGNGLIFCGPTGPITSVFARNGYLYFGVGTGLHIVSLTGDWCDRLDNSGRRRRLGTFAQRNSVLAEGAVITSGAIVSSQVTAVHAHVYPGAPLDVADMPIPTVAVATFDGLTLVHPSGQSVQGNVTAAFQRVLLGSYAVYAELSTTAISGKTTDGRGVIYVLDPYAFALRRLYSPSSVPALVSGGYQHVPTLALTLDGFATGRDTGLVLVAEDTATMAASMVAYITKDYATGWQPGDTRLATLCDRTTGSVSGAEMVINGGFDAGLANWAQGTGASLSVVAGKMRVASASDAWVISEQNIAAVVGQTYAVAANANKGTAGSGVIRCWGVEGAPVDRTATSSSDFSQIWQVTAALAVTTVQLQVRPVAGSSGQYAEFDNISIRPCSADRSCKGKGLAIYGTLQRNPVAAGAETVAWSGFSASNYLEQPYNTDLDYGTGDYFDAIWVNKNSGTSATIMRRQDPSAWAAGGRFIAVSGGALGCGIFGSSTVADPNTMNNGQWYFALACRRNGVLEMWVNGVLAGTSPTSATTTPSTAAPLRLGCGFDGSNVFNGSMALFRSGGYAPTPAQIRRMYADEASLMQDGAKCLLGGTSSAVTALDHDPLTGRLAVGTGDGVSIFRGLRRVSYLDEVALTATTNDTVRSVALRGGTLLIGTAAEVGVVQDAIGGKEAIAVGGPRPVGGGFVARGLTTDGAALDLAPRVPVGERETVLIEARIIGRVNGPADTERLTYIRRGTYYRDAGGAITLQGTVQTGGTDTEVSTAADATLAITGDWVAARVTGVTGKRIRWEATFTVTRISEESSYAA